MQKKKPWKRAGADEPSSKEADAGGEHTLEEHLPHAAMPAQGETVSRCSSNVTPLSSGDCETTVACLSLLIPFFQATVKL